MRELGEKEEKRDIKCNQELVKGVKPYKPDIIFPLAKFCGRNL